MIFTLPEFSLVLLIGPTSSGKSTFATRHFLPTEVIASDACRAMITDHENDQSITAEAFDLLRTITAKRLAARRLTVIDATNVQAESRKPLLELAKKYHCLPVAIVLNIPEEICLERNQKRQDRNLEPHVIRNHIRQLQRSLPQLQQEGFRYIHTLSSPQEMEDVTFVRQKLWTDKRSESGPFDIIGDIHGCFGELCILLTRLGYQIQPNTANPDGWLVLPPAGRRVIFLGDLVDRGPDSPGVLRLVMDMVDTGVALCVPGNHDIKLLRKLRGQKVQIRHGLAETIEQMNKESPEFHERVKTFLDTLVSHYVLDQGKLVVAHAGMREDMQGRSSGAIREFALYGETTGETDEFGLPVRYNWAAEYRGHATVVYGHTPVPEPEWLNHTLCIDTGCVFGGKLTALRYPEKELVQVDAACVYTEPIRPLHPNHTSSSRSAQQKNDDLLDINEFMGKRIIQTALRGRITLREENTAAALEVMSRYAVDPRWLIYLPPTMSPTETSQLPGLLEHPNEALHYYRKHQVEQVICEEKHMGSRAILVVCREPAVAQRRFGTLYPAWGECYTRTGRPFFPDTSMTTALLQRVSHAFSQSGLWDTLATDWACLDAELMPWSAKAQSLVLQQYAPVGVSATLALSATHDCLQQAVSRGLPVEELRDTIAQRQQMIAQYIRAYQQYCWPVSSIDDYKLAPFHVMATEGKVYTQNHHLWHMETLTCLCDADPTGLLFKTPYRVVDLQNTHQCEDIVHWWQQRTTQGSEGMVVKPMNFLEHRGKTFLQPALKCRGPEYLRIIYGPEYSTESHLEQLRERSLAQKRSLALREFALGIEGLQRFVEHQPLRHIHECVFGILALESEGVDPRL